MLRKILRALGWLVAAILGFVVILVVGVFAVTEWTFAKSFEIEDHPIPALAGPEAVAEGGRLASIRGCNGGCHGPTGNGRVFFTVPDGSRIIAPDLQKIAARYTDLELERAIRHGIKPDGTSVFGAMPSSMFHPLTDADLGAIVAWMRALQPGDADLPDSRMGPMLRGMILRYGSSTDFEPLAARSIDHDVAHDEPGDDAIERGRYLAMTACTECHGHDLEGGGKPLNAPSLHAAKAYSESDFERLMVEGVGLGDRDLGLMSEVALSRYSQFTDGERADLHAFLKAR